jgi:hypothetical protein
MIRYNKLIELNTNSQDQVTLRTDTGQTWLTVQLSDSKDRTPIGDWFRLSEPTEHRRCQLEYLLQPFAQVWGTPTLYQAYQKGRGYQQSSDVALFCWHDTKTWCLSTQTHTWIRKEQFRNFSFATGSAFDSVSTKLGQDFAWDLYETVRKSQKQQEIAVE